jgi:hypothetical protein
LHRQAWPNYAVDPILGHGSIGGPVGYTTLNATGARQLVYCMNLYTLADFNSAFRGGGCE